MLWALFFVDDFALDGFVVSFFAGGFSLAARFVLGLLFVSTLLVEFSADGLDPL
jgi:hypothetical protein